MSKNVKWTVGVSGKENLFSSEKRKLTREQLQESLKRNGYFRMRGGYLPLSLYGGLYYDSTNPVHQYFASIHYIVNVMHGTPVMSKDNTPHERMVELITEELGEVPEDAVVD